MVMNQTAEIPIRPKETQKEDEVRANLNERFYEILDDTINTFDDLTQFERKAWERDLVRHRDDALDAALRMDNPEGALGAIMRDRTWLNKQLEAEQRELGQDFEDNLRTIEIPAAGAPGDQTREEIINEHFDGVVENIAGTIDWSKEDQEDWLEDIKEAREQLIKIAAGNTDPNNKLREILSNPDSVKMVVAQKRGLESQTKTIPQAELVQQGNLEQMAQELGVNARHMEIMRRNFDGFAAEIGFKWEDFANASTETPKPRGLFGRVKGLFKKPVSLKMKMYRKMEKAYKETVQRGM